MSYKKLNYFKGELLHAEDFQCEQQYHVEMRRMHNAHLHSPGIVYGLEITAGTGEVAIGRGMAIDRNGKEIILADDVKFSLSGASIENLGIKFKESADPSSENTDTTFPGKKRTEESYELKFPADQDSVVVARIDPTKTPVVVDATVRSYSSPAVGGDLSVGGDLTIEGNLTVKGDTTVVTTETIKGNVELGDQDADTVTVKGVLKSGHSSKRLKIGAAADIAGDLTATGALQLGGNLTVTGTVDGRDVSADGAKLDALAAESAGKFHPSTGHRHTGAAGDAPRISHVNLEQVLAANPGSIDTSAIKHVSDAQAKSWQDHVGITSGNPHGTTAADVGAFAASGGTVRGNLAVLGNFGVGTENPTSKLSVDSDSFFRANVCTHTNAPNSPGTFQIGFSRGSAGAPAPVLNGDAIAFLEFAGYNGGAYIPGAWIVARARENFTPAASGTALEFMTHQIGTNTNLTKMVILDNGSVGIGTTDPGNDLLDVRGRCYSSGGWQTTNADYGEYFECADGNPIPVGTPVVLAGDGKIRAAREGEVPFGIASENSAVVGNSYKEWPHKYLRDKFGRRIMEKVSEPLKVPQRKKVVRERQVTRKERVTEEVVHQEIVLEGGKYLRKEKREQVSREVEVPLFQEVDLYDERGEKVIGKHRIPVLETHEEEVDVLDDKGLPVMVDAEQTVTVERPKLNPRYREETGYVPRAERPEWVCVGLLGQLPLIKGMPVAPGWIKMKDLAEDVELWLVK